MIRLRRPLATAASPRLAAAVATDAASSRERVWLLDLDNTLHDSSRHLLPRISREMTAFMMNRLALDQGAAAALREQYWKRYGATLLGLVAHHDIEPRDFLRATHRFPDMRQLVRRDQRLRQALARLPGRRVVVTNAPHHYARQVIGALGVAAMVEAIVSIETMRVAGRLRPKPSAALMRRIVARLRTQAGRCVLVEDSVDNLASARAARIGTVLVTGVAGRGDGMGAGLSRPSGPVRAHRRAGSTRIADLQVQSISHLVRSPALKRLA